MIFFDATKSGATAHRSGLMRVSRRLLEELGQAAQAVNWTPWRTTAATRHDWFLTPELFSTSEREGFDSFLREKRCRTAAIFHDAIPLRFPFITWPQSVARHPSYMKMLAEFDLVWAVSETSRDDLIGFWRWLGLARLPPVEVLPLGADFASAPREVNFPLPAGPPRLLGVGILEPRKNQLFLLEVCEALWREGMDFELHLVGRINPHFGQPVVARIKALRRTRRGLHYHAAASDAQVMALYRSTRLSVFPTIAEGNGLPLLESLWRGVPCMASDLPVLRENAGGGGCVLVKPDDLEAWKDNLRRALTDDVLVRQWRAEASARSLPLWKETAAKVMRRLEGGI